MRLIGRERGGGVVQRKRILISTIALFISLTARDNTCTQWLWVGASRVAASVRVSVYQLHPFDGSWQCQSVSDSIM